MEKMLVTSILSFFHNSFQKFFSLEALKVVISGVRLNETDEDLDKLTFYNSLPNNKILDQSKLKAFANEKINENQNMKFLLGRVENIVGKGENAGYQHFLFFTQCFQKLSLQESLKVGIVW